MDRGSKESEKKLEKSEEGRKGKISQIMEGRSNWEKKKDKTYDKKKKLNDIKYRNKTEVR